MVSILHINSITCVTFLSDGRVVIGSSDNKLYVWDRDMSSDRPEVTFKGHAKGITCVSALSDGHVASASLDNTLQIWNPNTGECLDVLEGMEVDVTKMNFSDAQLDRDIAGLLWHNGAKISEVDYERYVKTT